MTNLCANSDGLTGDNHYWEVNVLGHNTQLHELLWIIMKNDKQNRKLHYSLFCWNVWYMHIWILYIICPSENIIAELKKAWRCMERKPKNKGQQGVHVLAIFHQRQTACTLKGQEHCRYGAKDWATQRYCGYAPSKKMQLMGTKSKNDLDDNQELNFASLTRECTLLYRPPTKVRQTPPSWHH